MDAGGLAQMSYHSFPSSNGLGVPSSGFASRGKGAHIKRLSFEPTRNMEPQDNGAPTPRTSRSHLLAGLRTAPKSATAASFSSGRPGLEDSIHADKENIRTGYAAPKTAMASSFPSQQRQQQQQQAQYQSNGNVGMYGMSEQILAPPEIHIDEHDQDMDPNLYAQLVATNLYLAEQQQRLQQQLLNVQVAAQQFQTLNLAGLGQMQQQQQFATPPITPNYGVYQQQQQQSMQPIVTPVYGAQPGIYSVYNPVTGQQSYFMDPNAQFENQNNNSPPQQPATPRFQVSPPGSQSTRSHSASRSSSPPKHRHSPPVMDHEPLPPPSAGAFRRGHGRVASMRAAMATANASADAGPKSSKAANFSSVSTPLTGTFGPGAGRAGEHPTRQPRGPPSLDELLAKPTSKHEGSKNFSTRQRRSAVHNLVKAGMERRRAPGSAGSLTPVSETSEMAFSVASDVDDNESVRSGSGSLSGRPSLGDSRTSAHGAIGSDRPSSREKQRSHERNSVDSSFTTVSVSSDEGIGGSFAAVFKNGGKRPEHVEPNRKAPMLVLTSAEKRKNF